MPGLKDNTNLVWDRKDWEDETETERNLVGTTVAQLESSSYFTSELTAKWYTLRVSPNAVPYKLINSHSSSHPFHTQTQSFWQSEHSRLMLWQIFLKQTHTQSHTDTHRDPDGGISCGVKMGASAVLRARDKGWTELERERERNSTDRWNNEGSGGINSWHHCSRKIRLLAESLCREQRHSPGGMGGKAL